LEGILGHGPKRATGAVLKTFNGAQKWFKKGPCDAFPPQTNQGSLRRIHLIQGVFDGRILFVNEIRTRFAFHWRFGGKWSKMVVNMNERNWRKQ